jgi:predicted TIM-barrel fold metal-dependent hydrolase
MARVHASYLIHSEISSSTDHQTNMATTRLVPPDAWDTHIHVFDPDAFPYGTPRSYTPKAAVLKEYPFQTIHATNIMVVQATVQGNTPAPLLDALGANSKPPPCTGVRGLTTVDATTASDAELDALHSAGVRGVRMHEIKWGHGSESGADAIAGKIKAAAGRIARLGWVVDVFSDVRTWAAMDDMIRNDLDPRVKLVADHFGGTFPGDENLEEFKVFLELVKDGYVYVKLSGFERLYHGHGSGIETLQPIAKAIIAVGPEKIMYGSGMSNCLAKT